MRRFIAILGLHLKEFFKAPSSWVLMFILPIVFGFIFGGIVINAENQKPIMNIVQKDEELGPQVVKLLQKNKQYKWEKVSSTQAKENVLDQDAVAAIVIPKDIGQRIIDEKPLFDIIVQRKSEQYLGVVPFIEGTARLIFTTHQAIEPIGENELPELLDAVYANKGVKIAEEVMIKNNDKATVSIMFVGFAIMFMMFGLSGAASTILDEKSGGTWSRLLITPASKLDIILGYLGTYFCAGWIQFAMLMIAMNILFDASWGKLQYLIPFASLVILCVVGFGLMIAGLVKTKQQAMALSAIVITSSCMLGGVYWSLELVPTFMQNISLAVPQSWAMEGFKEIISGSLQTGTLLKDTFALSAFTILFFSIGLRIVRFK